MTEILMWGISTGIMIVGFLLNGAFLSGRVATRLDSQDAKIKAHDEEFNRIDAELEAKASVKWVDKIEKKAESSQSAEHCREFRETMITSTQRVEAAVMVIQERLMSGAAKPTGAVHVEVIRDGIKEMVKKI